MSEVESRVQPLVNAKEITALGIVYAEKKLQSLKNFGLFGPFFWPKLCGEGQTRARACHLR
jgi:hypothetical protein